MVDDVQLTDLEVIQRFSLAVRAATATREEIVTALRSDLAWLTGTAAPQLDDAGAAARRQAPARRRTAAQPAAGPPAAGPPSAGSPSAGPPVAGPPTPRRPRRAP